MSSQQDKDTKRLKKSVRQKPKPLTYQDVYNLCESIGISIWDFQHYTGHVLWRKDPAAPVKKKGLKYLYKVLTLYPQYNPLKKTLTFKEMEDFFKSYIPISDYIHPRIFPQLIGAHVATYMALRTKKEGYPTKPMVTAFEVVKNKILAEGPQAMADLIKIYIDIEKEGETEEKE